MKRNLLNFTRGSQLIEHFGFMFAAGFKGPLIIAFVVLSWTFWWTLSGGLSDHEVYLVGIRAYAAFYTFMEFDPAKQIALETAYGGTIQFPISVVGDFPPVVRAWDHLGDLARTAMWRAGLLLVPAFALYYWVAERFGDHSKERKHERGAMLVPLAQLVREIHTHNREERAAELAGALGWKWRLTFPWEAARILPYRPAHLARVSYPWRLEQSHAMLVGTTGMGKTVAMSEMVAEARSRGQRCVIFDLTGAFIEHFYDPSRDTILNPLDARCPQWSLFDECRTEAEFWAAADALIPHDGGGEAQFWVYAARSLFVEFSLKLVEAGRGSNEALARELMAADLARVHAMLRNTAAAPLTAPEAARMAESIRAVFNVNAKALKLLPTSGRKFSVRQWIDEGAEAGPDGGSILFVSARYIDMSVCKQLLTLWLDTAMNTLMALPRTRDLRTWFFIDELGALHRLPALEKGLQTARNFGGAIVLGLHAFAKLKEVYGDNMAMTLASLARTKLILGTADRETATWASDSIGHRQVRDMEEGYTYGYNNARDAVSLTPRKHVEPLLLPDQLMNLARLKGYLKFPDGFPAAHVTLTPVERGKVAETFIARAVDRPESSPDPEADAVPPGRPSGGSTGATNPPGSNDDGVGKPVVPKQQILAFTEPQQPTDVKHEPRPRRIEEKSDPQVRADRKTSSRHRAKANQQIKSARKGAPEKALRPEPRLTKVSRVQGDRAAVSKGTPTGPARGALEAKDLSGKAPDDARRMLLDGSTNERDDPHLDDPDFGEMGM